MSYSPKTATTSRRLCWNPSLATWDVFSLNQASFRDCEMSPMRRGALLLFDEVMTGFRLAYGGAAGTL